MKLGTGDFYENLSRKSKFGLSWTEVSGTSYEDLSTCYCCATVNVKW